MNEAFKEDVRQAAAEAAEDIRRESEVPTILMCGKTGAGKSSLCNAIAGANVQEIGVVPTTAEPEEVTFESDELVLRAIDVAGFGEADRHAERMNTLMALTGHVHVALLVVGHPNRALDHEVDFMLALRKRFGTSGRRLPLIIAANKIDVAKPTRSWKPGDLNLGEPSTEKENNISRWVKYVDAELTKHYPAEVVRPCAASEFWNDRANQYGIEDLRMDIFGVLPDAAQTYYARLIDDAAIREARARKIIYGAGATAAGAAAQPVPGVPDAALLVPIQVSMITGIAMVYGHDPANVDAVKLLGPALSTVSGRLAFEQAIKLLPGIGTVGAAAIAGAITVSLGHAYHSLIKNGVLAPSPEEFTAAFQSFHRGQSYLAQ